MEKFIRSTGLFRSSAGRASSTDCCEGAVSNSTETKDFFLDFNICINNYNILMTSVSINDICLQDDGGQ